MGLLMSSMSHGSAKMISFATEAVFDQFISKDKTEFDEFHAAMLDVFTTFNAAMPGRHYDAPRLKDVKVFFEDWNNATTDDEKRDKFLKFMIDNVKPSQSDPATLFTGLLTPPVALAAKKAGERLPQLKMIKNVPDVLFVPTATVVALISVKISRRIFMKKLATKSRPT